MSADPAEGIAVERAGLRGGLQDDCALGRRLGAGVGAEPAAIRNPLSHTAQQTSLDSSRPKQALSYCTSAEHLAMLGEGYLHRTY